MAKISGLLVPLFKPIGLDDWRLCTSLISGFMAKESVVSTLEILFADVGIESALSSLTASILLIFSLLYTPCVAAIAAVKRELGIKWAISVVIFQCLIAWLVCFIAKPLLMLMGV